LKSLALLTLLNPLVNTLYFTLSTENKRTHSLNTIVTLRGTSSCLSLAPQNLDSTMVPPPIPTWRRSNRSNAAGQNKTLQGYVLSREATSVTPQSSEEVEERVGKKRTRKIASSTDTDTEANDVDDAVDASSMGQSMRSAISSDTVILAMRLSALLRQSVVYEYQQISLHWMKRWAMLDMPRLSQ